MALRETCSKFQQNTNRKNDDMENVLEECEIKLMNFICLIDYLYNASDYQLYLFESNIFSMIIIEVIVYLYLLLKIA